MNYTRKLTRFFIFFSLIALSTHNATHAHAAQQAPSSLFATPTVDTKEEVWVTVFVHGIMSIQPHLTIQNVMRFVRDDVYDTVYSKTVEYMRCNPYFYLNQAMQGFGLKKIDTHDLQPGHAANAIANLYDNVTKINAPHTEGHYYTFGWSGLLSPTARYNDGIQLLNQLTQELQEKFWQHNIFPKVRLIGYSHGGNVCLNVAAARRDTAPDSPVVVDELILIGVPIQTETDYLVNDHIFKQIYHIFSRKDRIQRIDFFSFNRVFSRRYFRNRNSFKVPKKLMQIEMKFMRKKRSSRDSEKRREAFTNFANESIISGHSRLLRDNSPGHLEFWFFGWSPRHYRKNFVLHPLPAFIVLPYIIHCINQIKDQLKNPYPVIADIRPESETLIIKQRKHNNVTKIFPFLSEEELNHLSRIAHEVAIDSSFENEYNSHLQSGFQQARKYYHIYDDRKSRTGPRRRNRRMRKRNLTTHHIP